jgi:hypothetical protein
MYFNAGTHNNFRMALGPFYESVVLAARASDQAGESAGVCFRKESTTEDTKNTGNGVERST